MKKFSISILSIVCSMSALFSEGNTQGASVPSVGFGTYPFTGNPCTQAFLTAYRKGYRVFDTATFYNNFDAIAKAIKECDRSRISLISKVWHDKQNPEDLKKDLDATLKALGTDYLDVYLLHWPNSEIPIEKTLNAMNELKKEQKIRHIGLSNVTVNHLKRALEVGVPISCVQVEMSPNFFDEELLKFCKEKSIQVQAWAPLAKGEIANDRMLYKIGLRYKKTPAQIALKWIVQHGCLPLVASQNEDHIRDNLQIDDFTLSSNEMKRIDNRAKQGSRGRVKKEMIGFNDEFDFTYDQCWPKK